MIETSVVVEQTTTTTAKGPARKILFFALIFLSLMRIRFDWQFRRRLVQLFISTSIGKYTILYLSRLLLGTLIPPILIHFHYRWPTNIAQDGLPYFHHLKYVRRTRYGPHPREELDELLPVEGQDWNHPEKSSGFLPSGILHLVLVMARDAFQFIASGFDHHPHAIPRKIGRVKDDVPAILFGHGGGWVCPGTDVQLGQLPAVARGANMSIYTFNYPLAPEDPFPTAVISCLRALSYLKTHRGYDSVALVGESAGGNLITMAAMFACNPRLMARLAKEANSDCDTWDYPTVSCVVSWYSIVDHQQWRGPPGEHAWLWQGLETVWDWYLGPNPKLEGKATVCQWEDELEYYPPTLSLAGNYDPLGLFESTREFDAMLKRKGVNSTFSEYEATHGFIGYPPSMQQALAGGDESHWKENCAKATRETVEFLIRHHGQNRRTRVLGG